jgi:hypothetical protein
VRPVGGLSGELLQELDQQEKSRVSIIYKTLSVSMRNLCVQENFVSCNKEQT